MTAPDVAARRLLWLRIAVVVVAVAGMICIVTHHRDLGRFLIGGAVVGAIAVIVLGRQYLRR